jgi:class 3 adenylate cyclase
MSLPVGTVTFLFSDIEGSTRLWEKHPVAMADSLARHDAILRTAMEGAGGYVFKTVGDAFCVAFDTAGSALEAAVQSQRALHSEPWGATGPLRVRMAIHTGAAEFRDGDYFGNPLNRVARILAAAHGGQVLLSLPVEELLRDSIPAGVGLRDLG